MSSFLRLRSAYIVFSYFLISAIPFAALFLGMTVERPYQIITFELFGWLMLWSIMQRPKYFHWALLPVFLVVPIEIYLRLYYGQGISTHHLGIIAETSPKETLEFLGGKIWLLLIVFFVILAWWWSIFQILKQSEMFVWRHWSRWTGRPARAAPFGLEHVRTRRLEDHPEADAEHRPAV